MSFTSRPGQDSFTVLIQNKTPESYSYESRGHLRTAELEAFMTEALNTRYRAAPNTQSHLMLTVTIGMDVHTLPGYLQYQAPFILRPKRNPSQYVGMPSQGIALAIYFPPEICGKA